MTGKSQQEITGLLLAWNGGDRTALDQLMPLVYQELRRLARSYMRRQRSDHTLQTTALVNEAYLRLIDSSRVNWQNRAHFFGVSAMAMRRVLVDMARARGSEKRGGGAIVVTIDDAIDAAPDRSAEIVALDEALQSLAELSPRQAQVVELRYFGGLTEAEIAEVMKTSERTVRRDWTLARAWLKREIEK
ncbi:MAG: sigma-70 family RNA polymerase sigma factor [Acidobacteria bacterium]|nr:sigma-70 family RNA polymerase sigma factor [Acidobacteriota bacterium]MCW5971497.1 sigma-70 family RNA polymerase sigma factor [Blastocatellales bacterium]